MDMTRITDAILAVEAGPLAKEDGARLVEAFIEDMPRRPDTAWKTIGVECVWYMQLAPKTIAVGACDRMSQDDNGQCWFSEFKSKKPPRIKKDGQPYQGDTEYDWIAEIGAGPQLRIYALAQQLATFVDGDRTFQILAPVPHILVRAVNKSTPAVVWPTQADGGRFAFPQPYLDATKTALLNMAEQVRAARRIGSPWAVPSLHCINKYNRLCAFHAEFCGKGIHPNGLQATTDKSTDPGWQALKQLNIDLADPEVVIVSASSYANWLQCPEQYRLLVENVAQGDESMALETGSCMHAGIASAYRELVSNPTLAPVSS